MFKKCFCISVLLTNFTPDFYKLIFAAIFVNTYCYKMRIIKKLHIFILQSFLPLFAMTFCIVLFIVLMQFLWKYIDDLVGKGLEITVLAELFFYAAVSMVPTALPLAILLASLMTFGNLGEKFELTALKASGISLIKVMMPLIILILGIAVGDFYYQDYILPKAQVKMWTLLFSMKQKSPELEIPESVFYDQITGYNIFVEKKNHNTGMLYNVMIYDVSKGGDNATIMLADSAQLAFTEGMDHLYLHLYQGEQFENLQDQRSARQNIPFRRETFKDKQIMIAFDANFNRLDDETMRKQYVGKNIEELQHTIDSVSHRVDSIGLNYAQILLRKEYGGLQADITGSDNTIKPYIPVIMPEKAINIDSIFKCETAAKERNLLRSALSIAKGRQQEYEFKAISMADDRMSIRRHKIELLKKFTLSIACIIFFFIGAPLGAIIRKGGIGTPLVISVFLFIVYYIIDNSGYKLARDGRWEVWQGMWLSTAILTPLGVYVTIKAMNDSAVFNPDAYRNFFRRIIGAIETRNIQPKEVIINDISIDTAIIRLEKLHDLSEAFLNQYTRTQHYINYWINGYNTHALNELAEYLDETVDYLTDCRDQLVISKLMDFPVLRKLWVYKPSERKWIGFVAATLFPIGIPVYLIGISQQKRLKHDLTTIKSVSLKIKEMLLSGKNKPTILR